VVSNQELVGAEVNVEEFDVVFKFFEGVVIDI